MKLYEYEGKELFERVGITIPRRLALVEVGSIVPKITDFPVVVKAQLLSGKRGKRGLVKVVGSQEELEGFLKDNLGAEVDGERVERMLVEEAVEIERELYLSVTYSTKSRGRVLLVGEGGVEVEEGNNIREYELNPNEGTDDKKFEIRSTKIETNLKLQFQNIINEKTIDQFQTVVEKLIELFLEKDLFLAEINPLAVTKSGELVALDSKVVSDDAASFRQKWELPERSMLGRAKTQTELDSEAIDKEDHQGVVGRVYLDLDGDIGVIAAGGGASLVAMDALVSLGLRPANYTEFSGNPPEWRVERLTEIVLSKKNLKGAMLVGGKANFTDQVETLTGFMKALEKIQPKIPIVVRRDGPRMAEAKKMLENAAVKNGWKLVVMDANVPIVEAVGRLAEMVNIK